MSALCLLGSMLGSPLHAQVSAAPSVPAAQIAGANTVATVAANTGPAIDSVERADDVIRDGARQRAAVAARYAKDQQACSTAFFMTRCLDAAREHRRAELARLRTPEIEANAFKRRARVIERDRALDEKRLKSEQEASPDQRALKIRDGRPPAAPDAGDGKARTAKPPTDIRPDRPVAQRASKPLSAPISPAAQAANAASFDRKAAESAARQRVLAEKKAEKERDRAGKKARAAASEAAPVAP
ncbi:MAG: hypothetical protein H7327_16145 [Herminiimonas sp.]|nr:hypothetical protein [Herminiimonas sp.]